MKIVIAVLALMVANVASAQDDRYAPAWTYPAGPSLYSTMPLDSRPGDAKREFARERETYRREGIPRNYYRPRSSQPRTYDNSQRFQDLHNTRQQQLDSWKQNRGW